MDSDQEREVQALWERQIKGKGLKTARRAICKFLLWAATFNLALLAPQFVASSGIFSLEIEDICYTVEEREFSRDETVMT